MERSRVPRWRPHVEHQERSGQSRSSWTPSFELTENLWFSWSVRVAAASQRYSLPLFDAISLCINSHRRFYYDGRFAACGRISTGISRSQLAGCVLLFHFSCSPDNSFSLPAFGKYRVARDGFSFVLPLLLQKVETRRGFGEERH